jgi:hypothetical protein
LNLVVYLSVKPTQRNLSYCFVPDERVFVAESLVSGSVDLSVGTAQARLKDNRVGFEFERLSRPKIFLF